MRAAVVQRIPSTVTARHLECGCCAWRFRRHPCANARPPLEDLRVSTCCQAVPPGIADEDRAASRPEPAPCPSAASTPHRHGCRRCGHHRVAPSKISSGDVAGGEGLGADEQAVAHAYIVTGLRRWSRHRFPSRRLLYANVESTRQQVCARRDGPNQDWAAAGRASGRGRLPLIVHGVVGPAQAVQTPRPSL